MNRTTWLAALLSGPAIALAAEPGPPLAPHVEAATFQFADPRLRIDCVAAEPDVLSPVCIAWDARLRLFVVEMTDYPTAATGGRIRLLEDRDEDGRYESARVFAEGLPFPTSVLPWRDGVLVAAAPDILFLADADGDGKADSRRVMFTGFGRGNQQLRVNGLAWGPDGWVYGANGRSDGLVVVPGSPATNGASLRGRDFRFRPDSAGFETLAGRSQFGLALDDWGNRFLSWNTIPIRHEVFPDRHLADHAQFAGLDVVSDCMPAGDNGEVFPATPLPLVFNNESSSHFNALAGLTLYRGDALGPEYQGNAFVGETLRNLVHRRLLEANGPTFVARRPENRDEFLRSTDPWFHPVNFATGPDGALYVVDFYRQFVEHPDYVPREMRDRIDWRTGSVHGRIWRVRRKDRPPPAMPKRPDEARSRTLVKELEAPNGWRRDTGQRLLLERRDPGVSGPLLRLVKKGRTPESRGRALQTLEELGALDDTVVIGRFRDPHPRVREQAAALAGARLRMPGQRTEGGSHLFSLLLPLASDVDDRVRLQVALALAGWTNTAARDPVLRTMLETATNRWIRLAAASGLAETSDSLLASLRPQSSLRPPPPQPRGSDPDRQAVIQRSMGALQLAGDSRRGASTVTRLCLPCHYLQGHGQRIGPDLSGLASRPLDALLTDLLDPSRQVAPEYVVHEVTTHSGETVTGLIASESATRLVVRYAGAPDRALPRSDVLKVRATGRSLMPDGLEEGLSLQDVADLLAFLQKPEL